MGGITLRVMAISGTDLKVERVRARVTLVALAAQMGLSRNAVWGTERSEVVSPERVEEYRRALDSLRDVTTANVPA